MDKLRTRVLDSEMSYVERGTGDTIVFLHGNPTSSFIWRDIIGHLEGLGRCIAPDLIGMGDSAKLEPSGPDRYRFVEHRRYLDALLESLDIGDAVTIVGQDWGSALGFDWANRHRDRLKGIVHMEAIVRSWSRQGWPLPPEQQDVFLALRTDQGEPMVLDHNGFVEGLMTDGATLRTLTEEEMAEYRRPFAVPGEGRRPTLTWPREIPYEGTPADVSEIVESYVEWLPTSPVPKLFVNAEPGFLLDDETRDFCRSWKNQKEVTVRGRHFVQEDSPHEIGRAMADWYRGL